MARKIRNISFLDAYNIVRAAKKIHKPRKHLTNLGWESVEEGRRVLYVRENAAEL